MSKKELTAEQEQLARFAKALGNPVRIAILEMLANQTCCYHGDMSEVLPIAKSTISQHLNELKEAGLIQGTFTPPTVKYCINEENWEKAKKLFSTFFIPVNNADNKECSKETKRTKILILCTGNSCRSQMAHGFLQSFDPKLLVYSAGTHPAEKVNPKAIEVMAEAGIDILHHTPHSVEEYTGQEWDYVITVCGGANENCPAFSGKVKNRLHIGFDDPSDATGTPEFVRSEYIRVRDEIKQAFYELYINKIKGNE